MTAYRFRVKYDPDPTGLWRDIVVGGDRQISEFQATLNPAVGLDQDHLWFVGSDEGYWESAVKYQCPQEYEQSGDDGGGSGGGLGLGFREERLENAGEVTIGKMAEQLDIEQYDRICYLYDYGDEWQFYAILKEILDEKSSETDPAVVNEEGEPLDQYGSSKRGRF
jgi:hypothetical protein